MDRHLDPEVLLSLLDANDIDTITYEHLEGLFLNEDGLKDYIPDGLAQVDPRTGDRVIYNTARARRPHDNAPLEDRKLYSAPKRDCVICQGNTTGVVDVAALSEGFTFINKNLYPILYPVMKLARYPDTSPDQVAGTTGVHAAGLHFLQWTSSYHDLDWHNMPLPDRLVVLERLATLENKLLLDSAEKMPLTNQASGENPYHGYVSIIKNFGRLVGGSLSHGHQQVTLGNIMPRRVADHIRFIKQHGEPFSAFLFRENPETYTIVDYGPARLVVPYFMRRPYDMFLIINDASKSYLHQLERDELIAVAEGWHDAILAMLRILPQIGREPAYNVVANNGPGAGLYFEFLPYTQEIGGMEHLGMYLCQGNPGDTANQIRSILAEKLSFAD